MVEKRIASIGIVLALVVVGGIVVLETTISSSTQTFEANATVIESEPNQTINGTVGLVADPALRFGKLPYEPEGGVATRKTVQIESNGPIHTQLSADGNISRVLNMTEDQYFARNGTHELDIEFTPVERGYFQGQVQLRTETPAAGILSRLTAQWLSVKASYF